MRITSLSLHHFRNYEQLELQTDAPIIILSGHNGAGKTNLLEAVSLLTPGRGLRRAKFSEMDAQGRGQANQHLASTDSESCWVISAEIRKREVSHQLGTMRDATASGERRLVKIDGAKARSQNELSRLLAMSWLTPAMDSLFRDSDGDRRRFIDRLVYAFSPSHASHVSGYEKAMRERNALLKDAIDNPEWYSALEHKMAEAATEIASARIAMLAQLNSAINASHHGFPKADLSLNGEVEGWVCEGLSTEEVAKKMRIQWQQSRRSDMAAGRTLRGAHKTIVEITHIDKHMPAALCSTGEQKALLLSIVLSHALARRTLTGVAPIMLLDEVVAHLDTQRRMQLFDSLNEIGAQCWLTGTDAADFSAAPENTQFFNVENAKIMRG